MTDEPTAEQIDVLQAALQALNVDLRAELERDSDSADTVELDQPIGRLSRMDAIQQQRMAQAQRRRVKLRLGLIAQALAAIEDEEYGDCRSCGEPIGLRRLTVRPEAPFCIGCTEAAERRRR
jgi:DnaK suppressor protein